MTIHAFPANVTRLSAVHTMDGGGTCIMHAPEPEHVRIMRKSAICAGIGASVGDIVTRVFALPLPEPIRALFEDEIRQEVAIELMGADFPDDKRPVFEALACLAFERRLDQARTHTPKAITLST